jgi:predicted ArsR family transcriptional regulator
MNFESLSHMRRAILLILKQDGPAPMAKLASRLKVTKEAVRQQLVLLHKEGWIQKEVVRGGKVRSGRPTVRYTLTAAGDHVFPKSYDALAVELLETVGQKMGPEALRQLLAAFTETRVKRWQPLLEGKSLPEKLRSLKELYLAKDPFTSIEEAPGGYRLIENNCPFLNVAAQQPALCSVTVSTLTRLLGVQVTREERFQSGNGRCVFRVHADKPVNPKNFKFQWEPPASPSTSSKTAF